MKTNLYTFVEGELTSEFALHLHVCEITSLDFK